MLPDNMYTNSLRHRVRVRGCGALLWSEEFDFDTVLTPFMVKLFLENSYVSFTSMSLLNYNI